MSNVIHLVTVNDELRVGSVEIAERLGVDHRHAFRMIREFITDFEELGLVRFESAAVKAPGSRGAKHRKFAMLNEDQCYLLLSYSRNTDRVRGLKVALVKAFGAARRNGVAQALTVWQELQALHLEDASSFAKASLGSHLMLDRKRALPTLRNRRMTLERDIAPQLFKLTA